MPDTSDAQWSVVFTFPQREKASGDKPCLARCYSSNIQEHEHTEMAIGGALTALEGHQSLLDKLGEAEAVLRGIMAIAEAVASV